MNNIKYLFFLLILSSCVSTLPTSTQDIANTNTHTEDLTAYLPKSPVTPAQTKIHKTPQLPINTSLIITHRLDSSLAYLNNYTNKNIHYIKGLTIQVFSSTSRAKAKNAHLKVSKYFYKSNPVIIFDHPNYKVRMGEFYSPLEAYPIFKAVKSRFSRAILVPTEITLP